MSTPADGQWVGTRWIRIHDHVPVTVIEENGHRVKLRWRYHGGHATRPSWWAAKHLVLSNYERAPE